MCRNGVATSARISSTTIGIHTDACHCLDLGLLQALGTVLSEEHRFLYKQVHGADLKAVCVRLYGVDIGVSCFYFYETMSKIKYSIIIVVGLTPYAANFVDICVR